MLRKPREEPSLLELFRTDGAVRGEPSSLELSRVATEEDGVKVQPAIDEVNKKLREYEKIIYHIAVGMYMLYGFCTARQVVQEVG